MIGEPPLDAGAVHDNATWVLPGVGVSPVGEPGDVAGVDDTTGEEGRPVPTELTAETWKSYDTPFVRPVTVALVAVLTPSANVVNGVVPVVLYCIT